MKFFYAYFFIALSVPVRAFAYIDPATGNALFTLWVAIFSFFFFLVQYAYDNFFFLKKFFKRNKERHPLLIYSEGNTYWPFFEPVLDELENRGIKTEFYTSSEDDKCFSKNYKHIHPRFIGKGNKAYLTMAIVNADVVLMTTPGLNVYQLKRSKGVKKYVHFFHGPGDHCDYHLFGLDYYDTLLISNEVNASYIREIEAKRNLPPKELVVVGDISLDRLKRRNARQEGNGEGNSSQPVVLLAPSWGKESILYQCGDELLARLADSGYKTIIRPHPQIKIDNPQLLVELKEKYKNCPDFTWDENVDNFPSMQESSIMISDFSGIVIEYAFTFLKPVLMMNKDVNLAMYDASDLEHLTWKYEIHEKIGTQIDKGDIKNIVRIIEAFLESNISEKIKVTSNEYWKEQGNCAKNIVDYLEREIKNNAD